MKNNEILVFAKLDELLTRHSNNTQARKHLLILLNHAMSAYKNEQEGVNIKLSKQDILDKEFENDPNNPKSYDTGRITPEKIEKDLERIVFNNNQIVDEFLKIGYIPTFEKHQSEGGRNNPSYYWLSIKQIDSQDTIETQNNIHKIKYEYRDKSLIKLSLFAKLFFDKNYELKMMSFKGILLIACFMASFLLLILLVMFSIVFFMLLKDLPNPKLSTIFVFMAFFIICYFRYKSVHHPLTKLPEHRIIKAPRLFTHPLHTNAEIEFFGKEKDYKYNIARITEIRSVCPICTAPILLMDGRPDQSAPLVGRCIEAPHAHVYSFDRVMMVGYFLGHPAYLQESQSENDS